MNTNPMIVRVATAIAASQGTSDWQPFAATARAAIGALREPSPDMLEAALPGQPDWGDLPDDWKRMIDHLIAEPIVN